MKSHGYHGFHFPADSNAVDIVDLLEEVLNRGLALQIRVYPKARGAAETIINNQEDDDQQRTC